MPARANPSGMTVDQLTRELKSRNIVLPKSSIKKEILVDLYKKHVLSETASDNPIIYSSDDDARDVDSYSNSETTNATDISKLSDSELRARLKSFDKNVGPITNTTRSVYRKKLAKFMSGELSPQSMGDPSPSVATYSDDDDACAVEEEESLFIETHDVSVQNDYEDKYNGDHDESIDVEDARMAEKIEVIETKYSKAVLDSDQPHGSLWSEKYEDLDKGDSSRIRKSLLHSNNKAERSAPNRDFHRRSLALYGLTSRPPLSTYTSSRLTPTRITSYTQESDNCHQRLHQSDCSSRVLKKGKVKPRDSSHLKKLLIAVLVLLLLSSFGYLVYLNLEPDYLPKLLQNKD